LRAHRRDEAALDVEIGAAAIEIVVARGRALARAEQAIGELPGVIHKNAADLDRRGAFEVRDQG
jgi:hypothetical protein